MIYIHVCCELDRDYLGGLMGENKIKKFNVRILIVDDNVVNLALIKEILEMMDCKVDAAESGLEALRYYDQNPYDFIFMDMQMPDLNGLQVTEEIRRKEGALKHVPIIALTANALESDYEKCLKAGMDGYITKPLKIKELEGVLSKFLT